MVLLGMLLLGTLVGAIRWDAWHGELSEVGKAVEKTLSPPKYHFRLPWFAKIHPDGKVTIRGESREVLEQEIAYARQAGLDYWAFVTYPEDHPLSLPLLHFTKSNAGKGCGFATLLSGFALAVHNIFAVGLSAWSDIFVTRPM